MESLKGKTRGEDLYAHVSAVIERMKFPWSKLSNVTTDGSPNLTGKNVGLLKRIQDKVKEQNPEQDVIFLHCIIHQESLCKSVLHLNHVVDPVVKLVNFIRARGLNHRQFVTLLEETDADHQDLLYHSRVRWLSLGRVLQRVWELKEEISSFLELMGKSEEYSELSDVNWLSDFAFAVDIFSHLNDLNVKLQVKDQFVHNMYTNVSAFKSKLILFSRQMAKKSFAHFPTLAVQKGTIQNTDKYCKSLDDLHREFCRCFSDFKQIASSLQLVSCPLSQEPETAPPELQLELIDLQSDSALKEKFKSLKLNDFYASLDEAAFPNLRRTAQKMLVLFGSTYPPTLLPVPLQPPASSPMPLQIPPSSSVPQPQVSSYVPLPQHQVASSVPLPQHQVTDSGPLQQRVTDSGPLQHQVTNSRPLHHQVTGSSPLQH
ncbi:general transcription factor II-I repeat domain-containing protein 2A-like [Vanacampus margaritifer]